MSQEINILITGDFYGGGRIEKLIASESYEDIFNDFMPIIRKADLAITNLESAVTNSTNPISKTGPAIKAHPNTMKALKHAGFSMLTLANNHIMDFGVEGLSDTINLCRIHDIDFVGAGLNFSDASRTFYKEIKGIKLALINITENEWSTTHNQTPGSHPLNPVANYYTIKEAREKADFVFVIVHGGHELYNLPSPRMKETYRFFVDAGADCIIGHHTHCYSGYEIYAGKPVFYSLGNFIFDSTSKREQNWYSGYAVNFSLKSDSLSFKLIPYYQNYTKVGLKLMSKEEQQNFSAHIKKLNAIIQDNNDLEQHFKNYIKSVKKTYSAFLEPHSNKYLFAIQNRNLFPSLLSKRKQLLLQNLIRCEAHRDIVLSILNNL